MFQLKFINKSMLEEYLNGIRDLEANIISTDNTCKQIIDEYLRKTSGDSSFALYSFIGKVDEFENDIKCLPNGSKTAFAIVKNWTFAGNNINMLYLIGEIGIDADRIIVFDTDQEGECNVDIIMPTEHTPVISSLEELEQIWSEDILPDIQKCREYALVYALMNVQLMNYDENKIYFSASTYEPIELLTEYWRKAHIERCIEEHLGKEYDVEFILKDDEINIFEFNDMYSEQTKDLLVELQRCLIDIDNEDILTMQNGYREQYFEYVLKCVYENEGIIYLAEKNNKTVGMVVGLIETPDAEDKLVNRCPKKGRITELVVSDEMRGKGIGRRLVETMEKYFENKGCEFSRISVLDKNEKAKGLYRDFGYSPIETEMSKKLQ